MSFETAVKSNQSSKHQVCVVLTSTIDPRGIAFMERDDPNQRLSDYKCALSKWLAKPEVTAIVFVENSGYQLTQLEDLVKEENLNNQIIEFLSFDGQNFPRSLGKGYGESLALAYVAEHSYLLKNCKKFVKVNGRYNVSNIHSILRKIAGDYDVVCDLSKNLTWADSRVFGGNEEFLKRYLLPEGQKVNDTGSLFLEHALARAAHRALADGKRWALLPCVPLIEGIYGTANQPYRTRGLRVAAKTAVFELKKRIFGY